MTPFPLTTRHPAVYVRKGAPGSPHPGPVHDQMPKRKQPLVRWGTKIDEHYRTTWQAEPEACVFSAGPIHQLSHGFSVLRFPPHGSRTVWTYATRCMSVPDDEKPIELHMFSPRET